MLAELNGEDAERPTTWGKFKNLVREVLELGNGMADEMRKDAERWECEAEEERLQSPAGRQERGDECQEHG